VFNLFDSSWFDKREELVLTLVAVIIPMLTLPSMIF